MKFDNKIDVGSIVRDSFKNAMKTHGLVKEQEEQTGEPVAFEEDFNIEKHLSYLQLKPRLFGKKGTVEAADVDAVISGIIGKDMPPGLERFKKALSNLNRTLGKGTSEFGIPSAKEAGDRSSAAAIFSSLHLNYLLSAIINKQDARVAGKMFEGLVARMLGGSVENREDTIQDMTLSSGEYVSLKLIDPVTTEFKGSKRNLAFAIANKENKNKSVTYLVCEKDRRNDPLSFKAFSFQINKNNFFNFCTKKEGDLTVEDIKAQMEIIGVSVPLAMSTPAAPVAESKRRFLKEAASEDQQKFNYALKQFAIDKLGAQKPDSDEEITKEIIVKIRDYLQPLIVSTVGSESFKKLSRNNELYKEILSNIERINKSIPQSLGAKILNREDFNESFQQVKNLHDLMTDESYVNRVFKGTIEGNEGLMEIYNSIKPLIEFYETINDYYNQFSNTRVPQETPQAAKSEEEIAKAKEQEELRAANKQVVDKVINDFFTFLEAGSSKLEAGESEAQTSKSLEESSKKSDKKTADGEGKDTRTAGEKGPQISMSVQQAKNIATATGGAVDEDYEQVFVSSKTVFINAEQNKETLKQWIEPIYREFYSLDRGLKKFFISDEPVGLRNAEESTVKLKAEIEKVPKEGETYQKASQLYATPEKQQMGENKTQRPLTKHWSEIMLEELLND